MGLMCFIFGYAAGVMSSLCMFGKFKDEEIENRHLWERQLNRSQEEIDKEWIHEYYRKKSDDWED